MSKIQSLQPNSTPYPKQDGVGRVLTKVYGYIIDYKDLFKSVEGAIKDYTSGALDGFDKADVAGLLEDRLTTGREDLEAAREAIKALCEPVDAPKDTEAYIRYFVAKDSGNAEQLANNEQKRLALYKLTAAFVRAYANMANDLAAAGYTPAQIEKLKAEVEHFTNACAEVKQASGDEIDLKRFEPAMRHLIDTYIRAEDSEKISAFDDLSLINLIVERGQAAIDKLPAGIARSQKAAAETIENNLRKVIVDEQPINPKYYEQMSKLLDALIKKRKEEAIEYQEYLAQIVELAHQVANPAVGSRYPSTLDTPAKRALYDNLNKDEDLAVKLDQEIRAKKKDDWRGNTFKEKEVRNVIRECLAQYEISVDEVFDLVKNQNEY